ncbi:MAG: tetratricopeptide repeat protein [Acidobacteriota bacterium]
MLESRKKKAGVVLSLALLIGAVPAGRAEPNSAKTTDLSRFSNEELLSKADRAFRTRNFLASEKYYRELTNRLNQQLSQQARVELPQELEIEEELILAPFGQGHSLLYLHRYEEACRVLESALRIYPNWAADHSAMDFFQDPLFTGPVLGDLRERGRSHSDVSALVLQGYIQFFANELGEAKEAFSRALEIDGKSFLSLYFLKELQSAASTRPPTNPAGSEATGLPVDQLIQQGSTLFKNSEYGMAARLFQTVIETNASLPVVHIAYGDALFALGRFDEAAQAIVRGLEIYPQYAEQVINRRDFYGNPRDFDLQLSKLEKFVRDHPNDERAKFLLGYNYFFIQDYANASKHFGSPWRDESLGPSARYLQSLIPLLSHQSEGKSHRTN